MSEDRELKATLRRVAQLEDELDAIREERRRERIEQERKDAEQDKKLRAHTAKAGQAAGLISTALTIISQIVSHYL